MIMEQYIILLVATNVRRLLRSAEPEATDLLLPQFRIVRGDVLSRARGPELPEGERIHCKASAAHGHGETGLINRYQIG